MRFFCLCRGRGKALTFCGKKYILRMDKSGSMPKIQNGFGSKAGSYEKCSAETAKVLCVKRYCQSEPVFVRDWEILRYSLAQQIATPATKSLVRNDTVF